MPWIIPQQDKLSVGLHRNSQIIQLRQLPLFVLLYNFDCMATSFFKVNAHLLGDRRRKCVIKLMLLYSSLLFYRQTKQNPNPIVHFHILRVT